MIRKTEMTRRDWLQIATATGAAAAVSTRPCKFALAVESTTPHVLEVGSRRELFVDRYLIDQLDGMRLKLHEPRLAPPMLQPADNLEYGTVIRDGDLFRLYTRDVRGAKFDGDEPEVTRYCESRDGIHWTKPKLGLYEIDGSKENNIIMHERWVCHNFSPFLDVRPGVTKEKRFKALAGVHKGGGLVAFTSGDGVHWRKLQDKPVIAHNDFAFDSQNVSFWSETEQRYVCYFRTWKTPHGNLRTISRTTSQDFVSWSEAGRTQAELSRRASLYQPNTSLLSRPAHLHCVADAFSSAARQQYGYHVHDRARRQSIRPHVSRNIHPTWTRSEPVG